MNTGVFALGGAPTRFQLDWSPAPYSGSIRVADTPDWERFSDQIPVRLSCFIAHGKHTGVFVVFLDVGTGDL